MDYLIPSANGCAKINKSMNDFLSGDQALVFYGTVSEFQEVACLPFLSEEEITRAENYLLPFDKLRFIVSRAILKRLLSDFSGMNELEIQLEYGKNGKPSLRNNSDLQFNVSHSDQVFVIGFSLGKEIGIDVENLRRNVNVSALESFLFTPQEQELFQNMNPEKNQEVFIESWTKKEAVLKAGGDGLTKAMNLLDVAFLENKQFSLNTESEFHADHTDWFLENFNLMDHYRGAVAVKGKLNDIQYIPINESILSFNSISE